MRINFNWNNGRIDIDADAVINGMTLTNYRGFAKLFAQHGTPEQHSEFLDRLLVYINTETRKVWSNEYRRKYEILKRLV